MAAGGADHLLGMTAVQQHPCQAKTFAHGGAGPVQADEGDSQLPGRKGRGNDLVQQVAAQQKLHVLDPLPPLLDRHGDSVQIQLPFRQFEALLPVHFILGHMIKAVSQRPLPFLAAHKGGAAAKSRAGWQFNGLLTDPFAVHFAPPFRTQPRRIRISISSCVSV